MPRKPDTIAFWHGRLPHWEVVDGRYFVTIHLAGAIPEAGQHRIRTLAEAARQLPNHDSLNRLKLHRRVFSEMERWLDRIGPASHLQSPPIAEMITDAISFRHGRVWNMLEFVVMPSHLHLFFELTGDGLKKQLEQFKRWTGHEAAKLLGVDGAPFWQDEWFDHWSRSVEEDERIIRYIRQNPVKAGFVTDYLKWPYGGWRR
jgi:REP element-mobilizing transposase RayT